jgi:NAD+ synthetase
MNSPLHLALAQFKPRKGDYAANLARVRDIFAQAVALDPRPDVLQLPETALTGYFVEGGVRDLAVTGGTLARGLARAYAEVAGDGRPLDVVVGFYELFESTLYNSAMYVTLSGAAPRARVAEREGTDSEGPGSEDSGYVVRHVHRKNFLPTYGLFDEERFVERGHEIRAFDTPWGRAGILVCEDAWHSISGTVAALDGAEVIFISAAAPARGTWPREDGVPGPASVARWDRLVRDIAEEHGVFVSLTNLVGSEGGKLFGGTSTVAGPKGDVRVRGPLFDEAIITVSLDLADLARARADMPLLADFRTHLPHLLQVIDRIESGEPAAHAFDPADSDGMDRGLVRADAIAAAAAAADGTPLGSPLPSTAPAATGALRDTPVRDGAPGRVAPDGGEEGGPGGKSSANGSRPADGPRTLRQGALTAASVGAPPQQHDPATSGATQHPAAAPGNKSSPDAAPSARGAPPDHYVGGRDAGTRNQSSADAIRVVRVEAPDHGVPAPLDVDAPLVAEWLVQFIRDEFSRRGFTKAVVGVSGGVDSAVTSFLAARALGPANVVGVRLPYRTSSPQSLEHAQLVIDGLGIEGRTIDISPAVDGYLAQESDADAARRGNVMARMRMIALFDLSSKYHALPLGTGNKTERLFGYFTWHADDSPPVNPLGDLFKSQVWTLARHLGVPSAIVDKPASADLIQGQTDEGDFGISYAKADAVLNWMLSGYTPHDLVARGFDRNEVELVRKRLEGTHWKRRLPTVAMVSGTAIGESYLRPVDY